VHSGKLKLQFYSTRRREALSQRSPHHHLLGLGVAAQQPRIPPGRMALRLQISTILRHPKIVGRNSWRPSKPRAFTYHLQGNQVTSKQLLAGQQVHQERVRTPKTGLSVTT
jgi:serine/threonine protein kinase